VASKGDPSSVWVSPIQQKIERITFSTCYTTKTQDHFLNVIGETATCGQTKLTALYGSNPLDKTDLLEWKPVPGNPEYSYARAKIGDNSTRGYSVFRLENANGVIALVYGNGEDESYAYNVGSATIKRGVELNGITHVGAENTIESQFCLNDPIVLNAQVGTDAIDRIDWDFGDGKKMRSAPAQVEHQYAKAGAYTITAKLYTHKECPFTLYEPEDMIFHVQVGQPDTLRREYAICEGESFVHNGQLYAAPAQDTITYGCDSVEIFTVSKAECTTEVPDTVAIIPTEHEAEFTWPIIPYVFSYTLTIWIDEARTISLCTLTFNAAGQLVNIEFGSAFSNPTAYNSNYAPRRRRQQVIHVGTTTLDFTITGLENNHTYYYLLQALDATDIMVDSKEGHFTTGTYIIVTPDPSDPTDPLTPEPGEPSNPSNPSDPSEPSQEALDNTTIDLTPVKLLRSGQILILRDGKVYTVTGQEMK
jgi:hypothetical protein